jgi:hypothetical protein
VSKYLVVTVATFSIIGCSSTAIIETNIRKGYTKKLNSIFIITKTDPNGSPEFVKSMVEKLEVDLKAYSIKCKIHIYDPLGLNENKDIQAELEAFRPTAVLRLSQTAKTTIGGSGWGSGTFELSLTEPNEDVPFWKALISTKTPNSSFSYVGTGIAGHSSGNKIGDVNITVENLIKKLESDGLISKPS